MTQKTIRVRIAVAINTNEDWNAQGWSGAGDPEKRDMALDGLSQADGEIVYWIEADVPVPVPQTIQAETSHG